MKALEAVWVVTVAAAAMNVLVLLRNEHHRQKHSLFKIFISKHLASNGLFLIADNINIARSSSTS